MVFPNYPLDDDTPSAESLGSKLEGYLQSGQKEPVANPKSTRPVDGAALQDFLQSGQRPDITRDPSKLVTRITDPSAVRKLEDWLISGNKKIGGEGEEMSGVGVNVAGQTLTTEQVVEKVRKQFGIVDPRED